MEAGRLFTTFKTTSTRLYMRDTNRGVVDKSLEEKYPHIEQEHWDAFVAKSLTPEFSVMPLYFFHCHSFSLFIFINLIKF